MRTSGMRWLPLGERTSTEGVCRDQAVLSQKWGVRVHIPIALLTPEVLRVKTTAVVILTFKTSS